MRSVRAARALTFVITVGLVACAGDASVEEVGVPSGACAEGMRVGAFEITLADSFTSVQGSVHDAADPLRTLETVARSGSCALLAPPTYFCDPACASGTVCGPDDVCVPAPAAISVGEVSISGLSAPVSMTASEPIFFYSHRGTLDHPGFAVGAEIVLHASGGPAVAPFSLGVRGVNSLAETPATVSLQSGQAATVTWEPGSGAGGAAITAELNIAVHGGTPGRIVCSVEDVGSFEIPSELSDALLDRGYAGFPVLTLTRHSTDSTEIETGCVELSARSRRAIAVEIPGLSSCSGPEDCPGGAACLPDLRCAD